MEDYYENDPIYFEEESLADLSGRFRDVGGESALHPGVRTEPCPTCGEEAKLTVADVKKGYQCDSCAEGRSF